MGQKDTAKVLFSNTGTSQTLLRAGGIRFPGGTGTALPWDRQRREHGAALRVQPVPSTCWKQWDPRVGAPKRPPQLRPHNSSIPGAAQAAAFSSHSMATGCSPSTSRVLEFTSSLRISGEICGWLWNLSSSSKASFCSEERSSL